ncbi:NADH dehydrogenase subunit 3 (mitochondrion) [Cylas formicarius]|uniref:NADH-ubiquinone oxidoreductase chain 3 n=1 Tax=Cylas formicarius TaxID=197179 RepID=A0A6G6C6K0_CYLFO|nr:NADH dehydrogenase subunit 3 [Cylas formicarius]QID76641.1 NADH dehydrogenase subunit 3 [Cylas formicarius]
MMMIFYLSLMIMIIILMLMILINFLSMKMLIDREKSSPYECGFDPKNNSRMPFSLHFFLIALIFLIFDIELTLLLPIIFSLKFSNIFSLFYSISFFLVILLLGLFHEWKLGALEWSN